MDQQSRSQTEPIPAATRDVHLDNATSGATFTRTVQPSPRQDKDNSATPPAVPALPKHHTPQLRQHHIALLGHLQQRLRAIQLQLQVIDQPTFTGRGVGTGRDRRHPTPGVINDTGHRATPGLRRIRGTTETRSSRPVSANHVVQHQHPATTGHQMRRRRRTTPARNHSPGLGNPVPARTQRLRTRPSTALRRSPIQAPSITENLAHLGYQTVQ